MVVKRVFVVAASLLLAVLTVGWGGRDKSLETRYPHGVRVGYAVEAPYAFVDGSGRVTGAIPELGRFVAQRLGVRVTFVLSDFGALLDQLDEGRYDVVAAGLFITEERARRFRFSVPTFQASDSALVRSGNPKQLHSLDDARTTGATVVVLASSVEEALARRAGIPRDRTIAVPDAAAARRALESGRADLLLNSEPMVRWTATHESAGAFEVPDPFAADPSGPGEARLGGFAFRRGDDVLVDAWNGVLIDVIGTPAHLALVEPFAFTRRSLPPAVAAPRTSAAP
ncbi:MAG: transporter substrate-binding domain-containing protein [Vicinamibacterales bacterium]